VRELNRFEAILSTRDIFFEYARRLSSGQLLSASNFQVPRNEEVGTPPAKDIKSVPRLEITDSILEDFRQFLRNKNIEFADEDIQANVDFIKRRIKQEVYTSSFGLQEGYKVAVQGDTQVLKALDSLPEAKRLMLAGRATPAARNPEK
jgi:hypothetical protein